MDTAETPTATVPPITAPTRDWALARELHRQGATWDQIARQTNIPREACRHRARDEGWLRARDAVIVVKVEPGALQRGDDDRAANRDADRLRSLMVADTLATMERVTKRRPPGTMAEERARSSLMSELVERADTLCGWSRRDAVVGAVAVGYASSVLGSLKAVQAPIEAEVVDNQGVSGTCGG